MSINWDDVRRAFEILVFGWVGVFLVLSILYAACLGLIKLFPKK